MELKDINKEEEDPVPELKTAVPERGNFAVLIALASKLVKQVGTGTIVVEEVPNNIELKCHPKLSETAWPEGSMMGEGRAGTSMTSLLEEGGTVDGRGVMRELR